MLIFFKQQIFKNNKNKIFTLMRYAVNFRTILNMNLLFFEDHKIPINCDKI